MGILKKLKKYIPHVIAVILALGLVFGVFNYVKLNRQAREYREAMLNYSQLYTTVTGDNVKLATENSKLVTSNDALNKEIRKNKQEVQNVTEVFGNYKDSIENVTTVPDTVFLSDSTGVPVRRFDVTQGSFRIDGYFEVIVPYRITFDDISAKVHLEIAMTQDRDLLWRSYVTSQDPGFTVDDIQTSVRPYKPGFWKRLKFGVGLYASSNRVGALAGAYYGNFGINLLLDNNGAAVGAQYLFGIK